MKSPYLDQAQTYTDFSGLNALKAQSRQDKNAAMEKVAKQFEALFVSMMVKGMRDANKVFSEGNFLNSSQSEFYQSMFDSQLSLTMSHGKGIGVADQMMRQMAGKYGLDKPEADTDKARMRTSITDYPRTLPAFVRPEQLAQLPEALAQVDAEVQRLTPAATLVPVVDTNNNPEEALANARAPVSTDVLAPPAVTAQATAAAPAPAHFESPSDFVAHLYPVARQIEAETGIDARVMLAQSALETGWGKHMIAPTGVPSFNLFGIKSDSRWAGEAAEVLTTEYRQGVAMKERAAFRAYDSYADSFRDYASFLQAHPRYQSALQVVDDPAKFTQALQDAGYATDPAYSKKIQRIMNSDLMRDALDDVATTAGQTDTRLLAGRELSGDEVLQGARLERSVW